MAEINIEKRLKLLQEEVGKKPKIEIGEFNNWATTRNIKKLLCCEPKTLEEVQSVVKAAHKLKLRVRCTGAGHSWAPLFPDEGNILMRVRDLKRHDGPQIELKKEDGHNYVTVMSGVTVGELREFEVKNKVHLPCNVILLEPMYGGVIGAGCHGTGWNYKALPDYVIKMRIVDSSGELRTYSMTDDPEMFKAVSTNLGLFGVIYDMTFDLFDEMIVEATNEFHHKVKDLFYNPKYLKDIVLANDTVEVFWWPFNSCKWEDAAEHLTGFLGNKEKLTKDEWDPKEDETWVKLVNVKEPGSYDPKDIAKDHYYKWLNARTWLESKALQGFDDFLLAFPNEITPLYSKGSFNFLKESNNETVLQPMPDAVHYRPNIGMFSVHDMEFCFNCQDDFSVVTKACQAAIELTQEYAAKGEFPFNIALEMRWMADSDSYLCPAIVGNKQNGGSGHTVYIEVLSFTNTPGWKEFCDKLFQKWKKLQPTVHLAKEWQLLDGGTDYMKQSMSKQAPKFVAQLDKSKADPTGIFVNDTLQKIVFSGRKYPEYFDPEEKKKENKSSGTCSVL